MLRLCLCPSRRHRLQYLPITLAQCHLTALWLSENQSKPLLKLQRDVSEYDEEVFTCYMLPQQAYHTESMGKSADAPFPCVHVELMFMYM